MLKHVLAALLAFTLLQACNCPGTDVNPDGGAGGGAEGGGAGGGTGGGSTGGAGGGADGGGNLPDSGTCVGAAAPCDATLPCCDGQCVNGLCTSSTFCRGAGANCSTGADCCQGACVGGTCAAACQQVDAGCTSGAECCTGLCSTTCQALPAAGGNSCLVIGESCSAGGLLADGGLAPGGCCSNLCQNGTCQKAYYCQANGDLCRGNSDCCGNACSANDGGVGRCLFVAGGGGGGCTQQGNPCTSGTGCCSRVCVDPGSGTTVCLPAGGCRLTGTFCNGADECCGGGVNPNSSVACQGGRCDNGTSCNGVGNLCGKAPLPDGGILTVNADSNCCDGRLGTGGVNAVCKLDNSGIPRCFGGYSGSCPDGYTGEAGCCVAQGQSCQLREQCCDGLPCLPTDAGFACTGGTCKPLGDSCAADGECCAGTLCLGGACRPLSEASDAGVGDGGTDGGAPPDAGPLCTANGAACQFSAECCSLACVGGLCQRPQVCQGQGGVCTASADCCSGLACNVPGGATSGTCVANSCLSAGQTCAAGSLSCCAGLSCLDGNLAACGGTGQCTCTVPIQ